MVRLGDIVAAGVGIMAGIGYFHAEDIKVCLNSPTQEVSEREVITGQKLPTQYSRSLAEMIARHEGLRTISYDDTLGNRTIGVGFNLERADAREKIEKLGLDYNLVYSGVQDISEEQAYFLMEEDIRTAESDARKYIGESFGRLPCRVQDVLADMAFNLGYNRLSGFKNLRKKILQSDFQGAANEMKNSRWYNQVGNRSKDLVEIMSSSR